MILAELRHHATRASYHIRPYDFHRDRRVWRWRRSVCRPWLTVDGRLQRGWWGR